MPTTVSTQPRLASAKQRALQAALQTPAAEIAAAAAADPAPYRTIAARWTEQARQSGYQHRYTYQDVHRLLALFGLLPTRRARQ